VLDRMTACARPADRQPAAAPALRPARLPPRRPRRLLHPRHQPRL